jgi:hypothetical protein
VKEIIKIIGCDYCINSTTNSIIHLTLYGRGKPTHDLIDLPNVAGSHSAWGLEAQKIYEPPLHGQIEILLCSVHE